LKLSTEFAGGTLPDEAQHAALAAKTAAALQTLESGGGKGSDMLGWLHFPAAYLASEEYQRLCTAAKRIRDQAQVLLVIGIGGSYLGARAVIEALTSRYYNEIRTDAPAIYFTGNTLSESDYADLDQIIAGKDFAINVISKSGQTLECAVGFRHFRAQLEEKFAGDPAEVNRRIFVTTDTRRGALLEQAIENNWERFAVPDDMGGRYSVLSAVGLLPIACAGVDTAQLLQGAAHAQAAYAQPGERLEDNACCHYAALRDHYYRESGKFLEICAVYDPGMVMFGEWYKQLFGESEGKEGKGLFPASVAFTTDLHSLGQYIQQGRRLFFETTILFSEAANGLRLGRRENDGDALNYLAGKPMHEINGKAFLATALAHSHGGVPNLVLTLPRKDAYHIGWLIYFFEKACALSGTLLGVNPFDQEGVESYKRYMFALLGKAGAEHDAVRAQLHETYGISVNG
jgi:glucose-6-phosphate isomerase